MQDECLICEGIFAYKEKIIEVSGQRYCEACYHDMENQEEVK